MSNYPDMKLFFMKNDLKNNWCKNEIFDKKPIMKLYISVRIFFLLVHDVKEVIEGHYDPKLRYENHITGLIVRTILLTLVIFIAIIIYNKPPQPKKKIGPLPNQVR